MPFDNLLSNLNGAIDTGVDQTPDLEALLAEAAHRRAAAEAQADAARSGYQTALGQPAAQVSPLGAGIGMALSRLGTTLAGPKGPDYAGQERQAIAQRNAELDTERKSNLERLRLTYETAAKRAADVGDHEAEIKARVAIKKLDEARQQAEQASRFRNEATMEGTKQTGRKEMAGIEHQNRLNEQTHAAGLKPVADPEEFRGVYNDNVVTVSEAGPAGKAERFLNLTNFTDAKTRNAVSKMAAAEGIPALGKQDAAMVETVMNTNATIMDQVKDAFSTGLPEGAVQRALSYPGRKLSEVLQSRSDRAAFRGWAENAIKKIKTDAGGEGSGLRMTQYEISLVQRNMPSLTDTYETVQKKFIIIETLMQARMYPKLHKDWFNIRRQADLRARAAFEELKKEIPAAGGGSTVGMIQLTDKDGKDLPPISADEFAKRGGEAAAKAHGYTVKKL